jgi:hypothetical protein
LLPEEHFEFRGGADRAVRSGVRTRQGDPGHPSHQH